VTNFRVPTAWFVNISSEGSVLTPWMALVVG
jgi:hypothetical protein